MAKHTYGGDPAARPAFKTYSPTSSPASTDPSQPKPAPKQNNHDGSSVWFPKRETFTPPVRKPSGW